MCWIWIDTPNENLEFADDKHKIQLDNLERESLYMVEKIFFPNQLNYIIFQKISFLWFCILNFKCLNSIRNLKKAIKIDQYNRNAHLLYFSGVGVGVKVGFKWKIRCIENEQFLWALKIWCGNINKRNGQLLFR